MARVLHVTTSYPAREGDPSGHFVQTEARLSAREGHRVMVLAPRAAGRERIETAPDDGVAVEWLDGGDAFGWPGALSRLRENPLRALSVLRFVLAARRAVVNLPPFDEVVAHWIVPSAWPVALAARAPRFEVVAHGSDVRLLERLPRALRVALVSELVRAGARFRFVSHDLAARFAHGLPASVHDRCRVESSPIDVARAPSRGDARARLGLGSERVAVVVGRLIAAKHPARAVRLATPYADRVVVIGDGPLARSLGDECPHATLLGKLPRPETLTWIAAADLLVSASTAEGAPTVVREARALGTPVLAVAAGDLVRWAREDPGIRLIP